MSIEGELVKINHGSGNMCLWKRNHKTLFSLDAQIALAIGIPIIFRIKCSQNIAEVAGRNNDIHRLILCVTPFA